MAKKIKNKIFSGELGGVFRGMFTLLIGAGLARVVGLASIPILARLYSPEDYGVLAVYTSIVAILAPILTLRYVTAIPLPKTDAMAFNLFALCAKLILFGTFFIAIILAKFRETIFGWFSIEELASYWWLIVIGVMGTAVYELFSMWATRKKDYKVIAKTQFSQSLSGNMIKIGLGLLTLKPLGLIVGQMVAQSGGIGTYLKNELKDFKQLQPILQSKKQKLLACYYQDFPKYRLPSQFLMVLSLQAPVLMMATLYDNEVTGQLSLAMMALALPVGLVGGAMAKAYYGEIAALGKNNLEKITALTLSIQKSLFLVGTPFAAIVFFLSEIIFTVVFGREWTMAGVFASILAPFILFQFTSSPLMEIINILGKQIVYLVLHSLRIVGFLGIYIFMSVNQIDAKGFVMVISLYLSAFYFFASALVLMMLLIERKRLRFYVNKSS